MSSLPSVLVCLLLLVLGVRVLRQALDGGRFPERLVGIYFICIGVGAIPALTSKILPLDDSQLWMARAFGQGLLSVGYAALAVFAWRCFGSHAVWRKNLALAFCVTLMGMWGAYGIVDGFAMNSRLLQATVMIRGMILAWSLAETISFRARINRQLSIGLGDPVVANRFTLWSVWIGSLLAVSVVIAFVRIFIPGYATSSVAVHMTVSGTILSLAVVSAVSLGLSFFPPHAYATWLRGRTTI
jgi:hypothetical protein